MHQCEPEICVKLHTEKYFNANAGIKTDVDLQKDPKLKIVCFTFILWNDGIVPFGRIYCVCLGIKQRKKILVHFCKHNCVSGWDFYTGSNSNSNSVIVPITYFPIYNCVTMQYHALGSIKCLKMYEIVWSSKNNKKKYSNSSTNFSIGMYRNIPLLYIGRNNQANNTNSI